MDRRLLLPLLACVWAGGCGGGSDPVGAAITAGAAVAAAGVYRTATDGCWADCAPNEECDEISGMCVPSPCNAECPADYQCVWADGEQQCVLPRRAGADRLKPVEGGRKSDKETNHALCLLAGITDCPDRPHDEQAEEPAEVDIITGLGR